MSGITGIYHSKISSSATQDIQTTLNAMTHTLEHRGPDSHGTWIDPICGVGLGHRRLAVQDLSSTGQQPMISSCGRYVIVCDGETYNCNDIAKDLKTHQRYLKGTSYAEVILEACAQWGVESAVKRFNGTFAFALYDKKDQVLFLAKDRVGAKPLYYGCFNGMLFFGSELKALRANPNWQPRLNRSALATFMRFRYILGPESIYQSIYKLPPSSILKITQQGEYNITQYSNFETVFENKSKKNIIKTDQEVISEFHNLIIDAVKQRMSADVPLGTFLSGGIDSSLITAIVSKQSSNPINTFTIGFPEDKYDEAPYAKAIARHLGTLHTELYLNASDALSLVDKLPIWYDEPFADQSQIPTMFACELAKQQVGVVLSGEGCWDFLFGGDHLELVETWSKLKMLPYPIRLMIGQILNSPGSSFSPRMQRLGYYLQSKKPEDLYRAKKSRWEKPENIIKNAHELKEGIIWENSLDKLIPNILERIMFIDLQSSLPNSGLTKVDRASQRVALEQRIPGLDHRIIEYALQLPLHFKIRNQQSKWALRQILYQYVPKELIERPKKGFSMPLYTWLRGPLRDWAENLLSEDKLKSQNIFEYQIIRERWKAFQEGEPCVKQIWNVLMAQAWIEFNSDISFD
jgi:asparagine synthase (glutamine-hydrolysing)